MLILGGLGARILSTAIQLVATRLQLALSSPQAKTALVSSFLTFYRLLDPRQRFILSG